MSKRNQPYLPLYVQDFLTDEKLAECSAESTGVYIRLMCLMHKSEQYGKILLKQKYKQKSSNIENFAAMLAKQMPYDFAIILSGINELILENVIQIDGDFLIQKRMVKDELVSNSRSENGSKGGKKTAEKYKNFAKANTKAKIQANTENEIENEIEIENNKILDVKSNYEYSNWENEKIYFKNEEIYFKNLCSEYGYSKNEIYEKVDIFLKQRDLAEDYKDVKKLKNHFSNWIKLQKKESKKEFNPYTATGTEKFEHYKKMQEANKTSSE